MSRQSMMDEYGLSEKDFEPRREDEPTQLDRIEAQAMFTALMTDTLLEEVEM